MIKCKVIEKFSLKDFNKLKNIERVSLDTEGKLYVGDQFECDQKMADYLAGNNVLKKTVVEIIEVDPESKQEKVDEKAVIKDVENVEDLVQVDKQALETVKKIERELIPKPKKKKRK